MPTPRTDLPWRDSGAPAAAAVASLAQAVGVSPITADLLLRRGLTTAAAANSFLEPADNLSFDPLKMRGMQQAAGRIARALNAGEDILVFGDYDADGIPGTAVLVTYLRFAANAAGRGAVGYLIPNREDGYGLTDGAATRIITELRPKLVITVDCGSSDHDSIRKLQAAGIDVVVTDHHLTLKGVPPTPYFVNPSRGDGESYPFPYLCGCGVAYKVVQALSRRAHEPALYDLVALSTVGDQVSLTGENRFYVKAALAMLNDRRQGNLGIRALSEIANSSLETIDGDTIAMRIAPRINAVGRMGADPNMAVELLTTSDFGRAAELAKTMHKLNRERQDLTARLEEGALAAIGNKPPNFIVAYLPEATIGVAGLVAAKIVEHYQRPTLVVNAEGRGSGRAPRGLEIMPYMEQLRSMGIFGKERRDPITGSMVTPDFGGHAGACGFHNVDIAALRAAAGRLRVPTDRIGMLEVDGVVPLGAIDGQLCDEMSDLAPFGVGNPEPNLVFRGLTITESATNKYGKLILTVSDGRYVCQATWKDAAPLLGRLPAVVDLVGYPRIDAYTAAPAIKVAALRPAQ